MTQEEINNKVFESLANARNNGHDLGDLASIEVAEDLQKCDADLENESIIDIHLAVLECRHGWVVEPPYA